MMYYLLIITFIRIGHDGFLANFFSLGMISFTAASALIAERFPGIVNVCYYNISSFAL